MAYLMMPSIKERLWNKMRRDLAPYIPETNGNQLLICCACGRFLPQSSFDLEHLIPQQVARMSAAICGVNHPPHIAALIQAALAWD